MSAKYSYLDEIPHSSTHYYPFKNIVPTPYVDHFRAHGRLLKSKILHQNDIQVEKSSGLLRPKSSNGRPSGGFSYEIDENVMFTKNASHRALEEYLRKLREERKGRY